MIREYVYKCEICGETYATEEEAQKCEASHQSAHSVFYEGFPKGGKYPKYLVMNMDDNQRIQYVFDKPYYNLPGGDPHIETIYVSNDPVSGQVILIAHGYELPTQTMYTWKLSFDGVERIATSNSSQITLSPSLTTLFNESYVVTVIVSAPDIATTQFVLKEVDQ